MNWWLVSAYCVFFGGIALYALYMSARQRELDRRLARLRERMDANQ